MADPDRRTTIDGDQITDHTIGVEEIDYNGTPENLKMLIYDSATEKFKWFHFIRGRIYQ